MPVLGLESVLPPLVEAAPAAGEPAPSLGRRLVSFRRGPPPSKGRQLSICGVEPAASEPPAGPQLWRRQSSIRRAPGSDRQVSFEGGGAPASRPGGGAGLQSIVNKYLHRAKHAEVRAQESEMQRTRERKEYEERISSLEDDLQQTREALKVHQKANAGKLGRTDNTMELDEMGKKVQELSKRRAADMMVIARLQMALKARAREGDEILLKVASDAQKTPQSQPSASPNLDSFASLVDSGPNGECRVCGRAPPPPPLPPSPPTKPVIWSDSGTQTDPPPPPPPPTPPPAPESAPTPAPPRPLDVCPAALPDTEVQQARRQVAALREAAKSAREALATAQAAHEQVRSGLLRYATQLRDLVVDGTDNATANEVRSLWAGPILEAFEGGGAKEEEGVYSAALDTARILMRTVASRDADLKTARTAARLARAAKATSHVSDWAHQMRAVLDSVPAAAERVAGLWRDVPSAGKLSAAEERRALAAGLGTARALADVVAAQDEAPSQPFTPPLEAPAGSSKEATPIPSPPGSPARLHPPSPRVRVSRGQGHTRASPAPSEAATWAAGEGISSWEPDRSAPLSSWDTGGGAARCSVGQMPLVGAGKGQYGVRGSSRHGAQGTRAGSPATPPRVHPPPSERSAALRTSPPAAPTEESHVDFLSSTCSQVPPASPLPRACGRSPPQAAPYCDVVPRVVSSRRTLRIRGPWHRLHEQQTTPLDGETWLGHMHWPDVGLLPILQPPH